MKNVLRQTSNFQLHYQIAVHFQTLSRYQAMRGMLRRSLRICHISTDLPDLVPIQVLIVTKNIQFETNCTRSHNQGDDANTDDATNDDCTYEFLVPVAISP